MRWQALWLAGLIAGCSVPTPVGQLEPGPDATSGSQTTTDAVEPSSSSGATSTGGESSSGGAVAPSMTAFSIRWGDVPDSSGTQDPDALLVVMGLTTSSCEDVFAENPCGTWDVSFTLDPEQQLEGSFDALDVNANAFETLPEDDFGVCPSGGGTFESTVVIESIDDSGVQVRFEGVGFGVEQFDLDGFSAFAPRC